MAFRGMSDHETRWLMMLNRLLRMFDHLSYLGMILLSLLGVVLFDMLAWKYMEMPYVFMVCRLLSIMECWFFVGDTKKYKRWIKKERAYRAL